ncbi:MAG: hypothetical protein Q7T53_04575 [Deltaproteobacteria bacterium]|nr:hypothetical protein [Deltaproteobacteria bacterium]
MKNLFRINVLLLILLSHMTLKAEGAEWLGEYAGGEIPGYEILKSKMTANSSSGGPTHDEIPNYLELATKCQKNGGKAIINIRIIYSLGEVSWTKSDGSVEKISPGASGVIYGDCVYAVKPKK